MLNKIGALFLIGLILFNTSCITSNVSMEKDLGHFYKYKFGIRENGSKWKSSEFHNDTLTIKFTPYYNNIAVEVVNNFNRNITIDWNNTIFNENDIESKIFVWGSDFGKKDQNIPSSELRPGQGLRTGIIPAELVKYAPNDSLAGKNGYLIHQIYPDYDRKDDKESMIIMGLLGSDLFRLTIPVIVNGKVRRFPFTFVPVEIERVETSPIQ